MTIPTRANKFGCRLCVVAVAAMLGAAPRLAVSAEPAHDWPSEHWISFTDVSIASGFDRAFEEKGGRQPILRALAEYTTTKPNDAKAFSSWLQGKMKVAFKSNDRDKAYAYQGFLTCLSAGDCRKLSDLDPAVNIGVKPFEPSFDRNWEGVELPSGAVLWQEGRFGNTYKFAKTTEFWREDIGAYVMLASFINNASNDPSKLMYIPMELRFYSPCSFSGRGGGDGVARDGGPDLNMITGGRCR